MNVYQQVLVKLYQETEGKSGKTVNLMNLAKSLGLHGNYANIFEHLSREAWIAESVKADLVVITPDGAREAKKILNSTGGASEANRTEIVRHSNRAAALAGELAELLTAQALEPGQDFTPALEKLTELQKIIGAIKNNLL